MFDAGAIVTKLRIDAGDFAPTISSAKNQVQGLRDEIKALGRDLSQTGTRLLAVSAVIMGPLALAIRSAANRNLELSKSLRSVNTSLSEMVDSIVPALVPWMNRLAEGVRRLANFLSAMPKNIRDNIINFLALAGVITLVGGLVLKFIGNLQLLAVHLLTPLGLITALVGALTYLVFTNEKVAQSFFNTFEFVFRFLKKGFLETRAILSQFSADVIKSLATVMQGLASIPGPMQTAYTKAANALTNLSSDL